MADEDKDHEHRLTRVETIQTRHAEDIEGLKVSAKTVIKLESWFKSLRIGAIVLGFVFALFGWFVTNWQRVKALFLNGG